MKTTKPGVKAPLQFEPQIVEEFHAAVTERREIFGRKMAALIPLKDDIQTARANNWKYSEIAYKLSKGNLSVDSTTVARFCRDYLGEKPTKKAGKKGGQGGSGAALSPAPTLATTPTPTATTAKPTIEVS